MKQTTKHGLNLPDYTDTVDIEQLNENFKTIDDTLIPTGGASGQVLVRGEAEVEWRDTMDVTGGTEGQVLTKTETGAEWRDGGGSSGLPSGGTAGQVLTKTESGSGWEDIPPALPEITAADEGKFLCVVGGTWAATTITNANGVSF